MSQWVNICSIDDILPATGVCALLGQQQVAIFRPYHDDRVFAISNIDPFFNASVLSRGIIAEHDGALWVASPLKKTALPSKRRPVHGRCQPLYRPLRRSRERRTRSA
ncbi:nitrite reductase small subunit [Klebsiella pneumoniae]|nr:nitrite reductase small subunit [Klebsiella pneumoniae]